VGFEVNRLQRGRSHMSFFGARVSRTISYVGEAPDGLDASLDEEAQLLDPGLQAAADGPGAGRYGSAASP
jgi:hypothetical protein